MARKNRNDPHLLRDQIDGSALLQKIMTLVSYLEQGWMPEYSFPRDKPVASLTSEDFRVVDWINLSPGDVSRIRSSLDYYMRLLTKVLPDLKSVDVHDSRAAAGDTLSPNERAMKIFAALRQTPQGQALLERLTEPSGHNLPPNGPSTLQ